MIVNPLIHSDLIQAEKYLNGLNQRSEPYEIRPIKAKSRTLSQNALFHVWCRVLADNLGYLSPDNCKYDVKKHLLGLKERANRITGEVEYDEYKTSEMSKEEMKEFMDRMKIWAAAELNIYLPYWKDAGYEEMIKAYGK